MKSPLIQCLDGRVSTARNLGALRPIPGLPSIVWACATLTQVAPKVLSHFKSRGGPTVGIEG
jgi:hypothetical protein